VRPPGHHASASESAGFCIFNNAAVTAAYALQAYPQHVKRVLVLDLDIHHGNGTQEIFYNRSDVCSVSVHKQTFQLQGEEVEYPVDGRMDRTGAGAGASFNVNIPLGEDCGYVKLSYYERLCCRNWCFALVWVDKACKWTVRGVYIPRVRCLIFINPSATLRLLPPSLPPPFPLRDDDYYFVFTNLVLPLIGKYAPDFIVIAAGFDASIYDYSRPQGGYRLRFVLLTGVWDMTGKWERSTAATATATAALTPPSDHFSCLSTSPTRRTCYANTAQIATNAYCTQC